MICTACNRESKNLRVCPFCFTPYPPEPTAGSKRASTRMSSSKIPAPSLGGEMKAGAGNAASGLRDLVMRQSPMVRFAGAGIILVAILWLATGGNEPAFEPGVVQSNIIATPLQRDEALALIRTTRETALVDVQQDEVFVSYSPTTFPVREEGQLAIAQQFAQADEIVEGRKRRIFFYNPNGKLFAQADGVRGVMMVR